MPLNLISRYLSAGAYFTIDVGLLFSDRIRKILDVIPDDRLLTETDNPGGYKWLTRETGKPEHLKDMISTLADYRNLGESEVISLVTDNFQHLINQHDYLRKKSRFFEKT